MKIVHKKTRKKSSCQNSRDKQRVNDVIDNTLKKLLIDADKYQQKNQLEQANILYQQVLELAPQNICALNGVGLVALNAGMLLLAAEFFNSAYTLEPDNVTVNKNLGLVYSGLDDYDMAIRHYRYVLKIDTDNSDVHSKLAELYLKSGNISAAKKHYRFAFDLNPGNPENFQGLVQLDAKSITNDDIDIVESHLLKTDLPLDVRSRFYFSLGAIYDISEKYDEAFANFSVANLSKVAAFDAEKHSRYVSEVIETFSQNVFDEQAVNRTNHSIQPVFIVGMPQSGISSVEQLLVNNSNIYTAGKLKLIESIASKLHLTIDSSNNHHSSIENLTEGLLNDFSRYYLNYVNAMAINDGRKKSTHIIDKMPTNFLYLGLITQLFPSAKIIHCVRNPLDVCLSNYFKDFSLDNPYSYDQKNIAIYYQQYVRLMAHWKSVLPLEIHTVDYDDINSSPEITGRDLSRFIGIDWQPDRLSSCVSKHDINAIDALQLRQNQYRSSIRHWRHYKKYAHSLIKDLTLLHANGRPVNAAGMR